MATQEQIRSFLAHWFQLGKPVVLAGDHNECLPYPVYYKNGYSQSFEDCWRHIMATNGKGCYLKGTTQSVADMLSSAWDITPCARCDMPVAVPALGMMKYPCPCHDLHTWPNYDVPAPRMAVDDGHHLEEIQRRLNEIRAEQETEMRGPYETEETSVFSSWRIRS
jgi:hypothetical protein